MKTMQNQPGLRFGQRLVGHQVHASIQQFLQPFVESKEIVIRAFRIVKLDIHIHGAVATRLIACER